MRCELTFTNEYFRTRCPEDATIQVFARGERTLLCAQHAEEEMHMMEMVGVTFEYSMAEGGDHMTPTEPEVPEEPPDDDDEKAG